METRPSTSQDDLTPQLLDYLLHADNCKRNECTLPSCETIKYILSHWRTCTLGEDCTLSHCYSFGQFINHWRHSKPTKKCKLCFPTISHNTNDTSKENDNRGIIASKKGIDFHCYTLMTYCFNSYNYKLDNSSYEYKIQQEVNKTGKFDDLVYKFKTNGDTKWTRLLIQAKSKDQQNLIRPSNLLSSLNKETFGLAKFLKSTDEIKVDDECEDYYIIYTNAHFDLDSNGMLVECLQNRKQVSLSISKCSFPVFERDCQYMLQENNAAIFHEHDKQVKASEERWTTFLRKLVFVVGQPDLEKIKSVVDSKINNILPNLTEQIRCKLIDITDKSLYKNTEITSQQISKIIEDAKEEIEIYYKKYEESKVEFHSRLPLEDFLISTSTVLPIRSINSKFTLHKVCKKLKQLREEKPCVNKYTMKNVYNIIQVTELDNPILLKHNNLLIIGIETNDELGRFKNIQKNDDTKYILVCIKDDLNLSEIQNSFKVCEDKQNSFQMLTDESKNYILEEKCISLNQHKSSFSDILKVKFNDLTQEQVTGLNTVITEDVIKCFFDEDFRALEICFNRTGINNLDDSYIPRMLCCSAMIEEINLKLFKDLYIVDNLNKFKTMCEENPEQNVHHFIKYKKYLLWTQSNGDLTYIRHFVNEYKVTNVILINECNLFNVYNNVLISDNPGMGKSTLSSSVFNKLQSKHPTNIIIRLNLNDHTNAFNEYPDLSNPESTIDFLNNKLLAEAKSSVISNNILNFILQNKNKIFLLLDGVDEVCPDYKDTVFNFIKSINDLKYISLFVTTRPAQAANLKEILTTFALSIQPFSIQEQISYLNKILDRKNIDTEALLEKINKDSKLEEIFGVPLLLKIVAEIINNAEEELNIDETLNLYKIFNTFVNQKFNIYSNEKKKQDTTNTSVRGDDEVLLIDYKRKHEYLAMKLLFSEFKNQEILGETTIDRIMKVGIITQIKDQIPTFTHQTFAEYFASTFIETHLNEEQIIHILFTKVLVENDLTILRKLVNNNIQFDNEETKQIFSELIMKRYSKVNEIDYPLLSILFTAAYEDNLVTLNFILDNFSKYQIILEKMLSYYSTNTGLIPLQAAIKKGNIKIAELLINLCIERNIGSNSNSLMGEYLLGKDNTDDYTDDYSDGYSDDYSHGYAHSSYTALHDAADAGYKDIVILLLDKGLDINAVGYNCETALHMAANRNHKDVVSLLLDMGADANIVDNFRSTALHEAVSEGYKDVVRLLLDKGAVDNFLNNEGKTALEEAACVGHKDIVSLMLDKTTDKNIMNTLCNTALYEAAEGGHKDIVSLLLDKVKEVNALALYGAACGGNKEIVSLLLDKGVGVNTMYNDSETALHTAVSGGYKDVVSLLLDKGADIKKVNKFGETVLHKAAHRGHKDIVSLLLDKGAEINQISNSGETALHRAAIVGHTDVVSVLLANGADINKVNNDGETALYMAAYGIFGGYKRVLSLLLNTGADVTIVNNDGKTALHEAASGRHKDNVCLLLNKGANVNQVSNSGETALHRATTKEIVSVLLDKGADINKVNNDGETSLHIAAYEGNKEVASLLLNTGVDVNIQNNNGETALHRGAYGGFKDIVRLLLNEGAEIDKVNNNGETALHRAASVGHNDVVSLLVDKGGDVNKESLYGEIALHMAAYRRRKDVVSLLLEKGSDINKVNNSGEAPLHRAVSKGHVDIMHVLLDRNADINRASIKGFTPLHWAALCGRVEPTRVLLERGADVNISNYYGEQALQLAYRTGNYKLVQLLLRHDNDLYDYNDSDIGSEKGSVLHEELLCTVWKRNIYDVESWLTELYINTCDSHNRTPLYWAALLGECDIMRVLLNKGADVNIRDINDCTILQAAFRSGNYRAVQLLLRHNNSYLYNYYNSDSDSQWRTRDCIMGGFSKRKRKIFKKDHQNKKEVI